MASNQLTGFESLGMDVITSSGLCACFFFMDNHMAQGYIYQMQIWNVQIIVHYICFITGINLWHKDKCKQHSKWLPS